MKLIDKDTVIAEIEKAIDETAPSHDQQCQYEDGYYCGLYKAESIIDALEVKEVDLKKEFYNYTKNILACDVQFEPFTHLYNCAKYFYELGLKSKKNE